MPEPSSTFEYLSEYDPPAPVIKLGIASPISPSFLTEAFLVDSGADMTSIKREIFDILKLEYAGYVKVGGVVGKPEIRQTAVVRIETPLRTVELAEVIVDPNAQENLLGRDIINKWKVLLDGPEQKFSIVS
jgi:predicted aspartyl protease